MKSFAEMALDEAWFMYLSPRNKKEENELLLAKVIDEKMRHLDDLETKAEGARFDVEKLLLERKMHNRVMKGKLSKAKKEDWKYNFCEDWLTMVKGRLAELEAEIEYESKWLDTATASLTTERYRIIPFGFFDHYHWDYEDVDYWGRDFRSEDDEPEEFDDDFVDERLNGPDFFDKLS